MGLMLVKGILKYIPDRLDPKKTMARIIISMVSFCTEWCPQ